MIVLRQVTTQNVPLLDNSSSLRPPVTMEDIIGGVDAPMTDLEESLFHQFGMKEAPFAGMDKSGRGVCVKHYQGLCQFGQTCPLRHLVGEKMVVCKHWLRGLCKKGDQCEFLHEYDLTKMPECFFFSKYMACSNRECPFRHIDPETKLKDCPWYERGFCRHGPYCKHRHRRRVMCPKYLVGFCPEGPNCKFAHPSFALPGPENPVTNNKKLFGQAIVCHNCHERGHKATNCPNLPNHKMPDIQPAHNRGPIDISMIPDKKVLSEVTCYKCGEKGHYANRCHKGVLAFLSNTAHLAQEQRERDEKEGRRMANKKKKVGRPRVEERDSENESPPPKKVKKEPIEPKKRGRKSKAETKLEPPPPPKKPCNIDFSKGYTVPLRGLQSAITCGICKGFLIDASTIVECLHTFCKSCILKYFDEEDNCCPTCGQLVHQSHPTSYIAHDRTLQDIIYKLVPGLYEHEVREREGVVRKLKIEAGEDIEAEEKRKAEKQKELEADRTNRCYEGRSKHSHHRDEPQMVIELIPGVDDLPIPPKRFIRTGEMCTVTTLKRYLSYAIYGSKSRHRELDLYFKNELMGRDFSMKFIQVTRCRNKPPDQPLRLIYRHRKEF